MKFARVFRDDLEREGYPSHWLDLAIPYGQLKKCLKKVQRELWTLGLDSKTARELLEARDDSGGGHSGNAVIYRLDPTKSEKLTPKLTVFVKLKDGLVVDASLSPASRMFLEKLAKSKASPAQDQCGEEEAILPPSSPGFSTGNISSEDACFSGSGDEQQVRRVEVPLIFDGEFFQILQADVASLDALQEAEQCTMEKDIARLGQEIAEVTKPNKMAKSDLSRWREIFEVYLDGRVFFSTKELDHGARTSSTALAQLIWFQNEVGRRDLTSKFKLPASRFAYRHFLALNATLLQNVKFQELNRRAVTKILKKFDKRTSFDVSRNFPSAISSKRFMGESVAKDICARVSTEVMSLVPRLDDYLCPICFGLAYLPVRLKCQHVFCIRCVIKMQRERKRHCALCRADCVLDADTLNLDTDLTKFLEKWFRKESKEKQKANEIERGRELFGDDYQHSSCKVM